MQKKISSVHLGPNFVKTTETLIGDVNQSIFLFFLYIRHDFHPSCYIEFT